MNTVAPATVDQTCLAILAGGQGRRLGGVAKGLLIVEGETVLTRLLRLAPGFGDCLLATDDPEPYDSFGVRKFADPIPGRGAPGGVLAALSGARTPLVLVVACDMPFVTRAVVEALLRRFTDSDPALCFRVAGRLEPLLGVYRRSLAPAWEVRLREADGRAPSMKDLFAAVGGKAVDEAVLREVDPTLCATVSVNRPEDLARWKLQIPDPTRTGSLI